MARTNGVLTAVQTAGSSGGLGLDGRPVGDGSSNSNSPPSTRRGATYDELRNCTPHRLVAGAPFRTTTAPSILATHIALPYLPSSVSIVQA